MRNFIAIFALLPAIAHADVNAVIDDHILPGYAAFASKAQTLAENTRTCEISPIRAAFHDTFDAWMSISHIQFGPIETQGTSLKISYWPDPKSKTSKTLKRLISSEDPAVNDPTEYSEVSVAGQGFFALEHMLFEEEPGEYTCQLTHAVALELSKNAQALNDAWQDGYGDVLRTASDPFQSPAEVQRVLYTALATGLEFLETQRLGRPLGKFDRPRPKRAEAWRSERSQRNVTLALEALMTMATKFADQPTPKTKAAFQDATTRANDLDDPAFAGVADPAKRFKVEVLQQKVGTIRVAIDREIGAVLGVRAGFNSLDGD